MKRLLVASLLSAFSFSAFAQVNPFSIFEGKYEIQNCKCLGTGLDKFSYDPCSLQGVEVRSYKTTDGQTAWVLDEIFLTKYTVRPLDELAIKPMLKAGETVVTSVHGNSDLAEVVFTTNKGGISNYQILRSGGGFQYAGGFKGVENGLPIDVQCYHSLIKK